MMFNNQQDLPFDPINLQVQPIQFSMTNPPYMPSNIECNEALMQYVGVTSALLAHEIQEKATMHGANFLRIFMYNQCAPNNFATEAFDALLQATMDYVTYLLTDPISIPNPSIENAIGVAVPQMVYMLAAENCRTYPRLGNEVPPNLHGTLKGLLDQYDFLARDIGNLKNGGQKSNNSRMGNQGGFGRGVAANNNNRGTFGGGSGRMQQNNNRSFGGAAAAPTSRSGGSGLFNNTGPAQSSGGFGKAAATTQGGFGKAPVSNTKVSMTAITKPSVNNQPGKQYAQPDFQKGNAVIPDIKVDEDLVNVAYNDETWVGSPRYPYFPAFRPTTMELTYTIKPDNSTEPNLREIDPSMEYDRHEMPSAFGKTPEAFDLSNTAKQLARIQKGAVLINSESAMVSKQAIEGGEPVVTIHHASQVLIATSLTEAWIDVQLKRLRTEPQSDVYRARAEVILPIIVGKDEEEVVANLGRCMTYVGLREQLEASYGKISPELWSAINNRITKIVNRSIRLELGIEPLSIGNFREDLVELMEYIESKFGKAVLAAFKSNQEKHIKEATALVNNEEFESISKSFTEGAGFDADKAPKMLGLMTSYSLTLLNCYAHDLEIELGNNGIGSAITHELLPDVYALVKGIFDSPSADKSHRYLLRTNDGFILEAAMGALGDGHYLLALVK